MDDKDERRADQARVVADMVRGIERSVLQLATCSTEPESIESLCVTAVAADARLQEAGLTHARWAAVAETHPGNKPIEAAAVASWWAWYEAAGVAFAVCVALKTARARNQAKARRSGT
jgi:hypothetical protein